MSAHTPGPWVHHQEDNIITTPNGFCKLLEWQARSMHVSQEERDANARLIAAAPELLAALRALEAMAERYRPLGSPTPEAQKNARIAIARATGSQP